MMWFVRAVRGAFLVALVIALVVSANLLMGSTRSARSADQPPPDATTAEVDVQPDEIQPDGVQADEIQPDEGAALGDDTGTTADDPAGDQPADLSDDLVDATEPAPRAADSKEALDSTGAVELAAPTAPEASGQQAAESASQGKHKRTVVGNLTYGSGAASLGLSVSSDKRPIGPASFAIDASGNIFVSDNVNGRVQVYSAQGKLVRSLKADTYVYDLAVGEANDLYLLGADGSLAILDATTGKVEANGAVAEVASEELGKLRVTNGQLVLESPLQVTYPLATRRDGAIALLSSKEQSSGQSKGAATRSQDRYTTSYRDGGHVYRLDSKGKTVQDVALRLSDIATVVFLQEDRAGNVYIQVERASDDEQISVEVRQYSKSGELAAVVPVDRVDYIQMTKSTIVTEGGTIYQLVPTAQGVALVKFQRP